MSPLYHRIKWALPRDTPLLVAPLADAPNFKGMAEGALKWVRGRDDGGKSGVDAGSGAA